MFNLKIQKSKVTVLEREPLVSGASKLYELVFSFDESWDGLDKTAIFKAGNISVSTLIEGDRCKLPWEVLAKENEGEYLWVGVYGSNSDGLKLPTLWNQLGIIQPGTSPAKSEAEATPTLLSHLNSLIESIESSAKLAAEQALAAKNFAFEAKGYAEDSAESYEDAEEARASAAEAEKNAMFYTKSMKDSLMNDPKYIQKVVRSGEARNIFSCGDIISVDMNSGSTYDFEVIGFDTHPAKLQDGSDAEHTMLLQLNSLYFEMEQYCTGESFYVNTEELPAGYYCFDTTLGPGFYFSLDTPVSANSQFHISQKSYTEQYDSIIDIFSGYEENISSKFIFANRQPTEGINYTLLTEGQNDMPIFCKNGNANYSESSINAFLCGRKPERKFSRPANSYHRDIHFYNNLNEEFRSIVAPCKGIYPDNDNTAPVFLLSAEECDVAAGTALEYFMQKGTALRLDSKGNAKQQWLRNSTNTNSYLADYIDTDGTIVRKSQSKGTAITFKHFAPCLLVA